MTSALLAKNCSESSLLSHHPLNSKFGYSDFRRSSSGPSPQIVPRNPSLASALQKARDSFLYQDAPQKVTSLLAWIPKANTIFYRDRIGQVDRLAIVKRISPQNVVGEIGKVAQRRLSASDGFGLPCNAP